MLRMPKWYRLRDWLIGPFIWVDTESEIIDFVMFADWFSHSHQERVRDMDLVFSQRYVQMAPTRLGVLIKVVENHRTKRERLISICLYDRRIITANLFQLQTYADLFSQFAKMSICN